MSMDIRPNPLHHGVPEKHVPFRSSGGLPSEWKLRVIVFGSALGIVLVLAAVWYYLLGAPGAPEGVRRTLGKLPTAGERLLPEEEPAPAALPVPETTSPLSGLPCPQAQRRPIGVMLAADPINRPVSGFAFADVVFELPVLTNNVMRLLAVYQCQEPREIGSVRSARHDYLFLATGVDAVIAHWGGSYHALNRIRLESRVYESLSALGTGQQAFYRKASIPRPYNGFTSFARLWDALVKAGYRTTTTFAGYPHVDEAPPGQRGAGGTLDVGYPGVMRVRYVYNPQTNSYDRFWGGVRHLDAVDNAPVSPKVVVVAYTTQTLAKGPGGYNDVAVEGSGKVEVYQNGQVVPGTWVKSEVHKRDPLVFQDAAGVPLPLVRGQLWVHFVDQGTQVLWAPGPASAAPDLNTGATPTNLGE